MLSWASAPQEFIQSPCLAIWTILEAAQAGGHRATRPFRSNFNFRSVTATVAELLRQRRCSERLCVPARFRPSSSFGRTFGFWQSCNFSSRNSADLQFRPTGSAISAESQFRPGRSFIRVVVPAEQPTWHIAGRPGTEIYNIHWHGPAPRPTVRKRPAPRKVPSLLSAPAKGAGNSPLSPRSETLSGLSDRGGGLKNIIRTASTALGLGVADRGRSRYSSSPLHNNVP